MKKNPAELRRKREYLREKNWYRRLQLRLLYDSQFQRSMAQGAFALLCIWIGIEFHLFVRWGASSGSATYAERPPGAEGFLPISALISLKYWIQTSVINTIHPSGLFIFLAIVAVSVVAKKAFCGWLCPVGSLSEAIWMLGEKIFKRTFILPRWLDYPLRSLKYLLLAFFVWSISSMDIPALAAFIESPYNRVADIKMYFFFAEISGAALWTVAILMLASLFVKNFWCRYLCPYGALLGITGLFSPLRIKRTASTCIDCELCTKACPSSIKVHKVTTVMSDECMSCMRCVEVCPVKETLVVKPVLIQRAVPGWVMAMLIVGIFVGVTGFAMVTGHWQNAISKEEYRTRFQELHGPQYEHFQGTANGK
jgi:polyferredoxin